MTRQEPNPDTISLMNDTVVDLLGYLTTSQFKAAVTEQGANAYTVTGIGKSLDRRFMTGFETTIEPLLENETDVPDGKNAPTIITLLGFLTADQMADSVITHNRPISLVYDIARIIDDENGSGVEAEVGESIREWMIDRESGVL